MFPCSTPDPPYYAVIFPYTKTGNDPDYDTMAVKMKTLVAEQPGFLGIESIRNASGQGITISYWDSEAAIRNWQQHTEHKIAQAKGIALWYDDYRIRVAKVERAYGKQDETQT